MKIHIGYKSALNHFI